MAQAAEVARAAADPTTRATTPPLALRAGLTLRDKWISSFGLLAVCGLAWAAMAWQAGATMMKMGAGLQWLLDTVGQAARNIVTGVFGRTWDWSKRSSKHIAFDLRGPEAFTWRKPLK